MSSEFSRRLPFRRLHVIMEKVIYTHFGTEGNGLDTNERGNDKSAHIDKDTRINLVLNNPRGSDDYVDLGHVYQNFKRLRKIYAWVLLLCLVAGICASRPDRPRRLRTGSGADHILLCAAIGHQRPSAFPARHAGQPQQQHQNREDPYRGQPAQAGDRRQHASG